MRVTIKQQTTIGNIETFPLSQAPSNKLRIEYMGLKFCAATSSGCSSSVELYIDDTPNARQIAAIAVYVFNATSLAPSSVEAVVDALYELFPQATEFPECVRVKPGHEPDYLAEVLRKKFGPPNTGEDFSLSNMLLQIACDLYFGALEKQSETLLDPKRWVFYATKQAMQQAIKATSDVTITTSLLRGFGFSPYGGVLRRYIGCYATYLGRPSLENVSYADILSSLKTALESFPKIQ